MTEADATPRVLQHPALQSFQAKIRNAYGPRVERIVLYGSRARGDSTSDSDYDVAVFLHDLPDRWEEVNRIADLATDVIVETGEVIHAMPFRAVVAGRNAVDA